MHVHANVLRGKAVGRTTDNYHQIEKVIADYVEGGNGNAELLRSVFLPTAIINGSPIEELYRIVRERGETHSTGRIDMLDIQNGVASAKVSEGWKISSKSGVEYIEAKYRM